MKWFVKQAIAKQVKRKLKTSRDFAMRTNDTSYNEQAEVVKIVKDEYLRCKKTFKKLLEMEPQLESAIQIEKDLNRTFPTNIYFKENQKGFLRLRKVLRAFSCYDKQVNYV